MKMIFINLGIFLILSYQKCIFNNYKNSYKIINLDVKNNILDYHPLKIYFDFSNIFNKNNKKEYSNILNIFNQVSNILYQLISIKNIQKIILIEKKICNINLKINKNIIRGIDSDLIIIPLIDESVNDVVGRVCFIDKYSRNSIISLLYLPQNLQFNTKKVLHQLFHILGFNANNVQINNKYHIRTFKTYQKLFKDLKNKSFNINNTDWNNNVFIKDIMNDNEQFEDISELTLSFLKDKNNNYKFSKCFINKPINNNIIYYGTDSKGKLICYLNSKNNIENNQCGINKFPLKSDIYNKSKNHNYKVYQTLNLLIPSEKCPKKHPRTVWFYNINKYSNRTISKKFKIETIDITNPNYIVRIVTKRGFGCFFNTYKLIMKFNNINANKNLWKINYFDNQYKEKTILKIIRKLNKYIFYNIFHFIYNLEKKDDLYRNYRRMKKKFPEDYDFMQESYILPDDREIIEKKFKNYTPSKDNLWLIKPSDGFQGKGINILRNFSNLYKEGIITHYIPNPFLLNGKKFDLRIYILISSFLPLKIYFNNEGLVRICTDNYNLDEKNFDNKFIHLTNTILNKRNKNNFINGESVTDEKGNLWSFKSFKNYLSKKGINSKNLFDRIKDLIIKSILSIEYIFSKESRKKYFGKKVSTVIGLDVLIDENLNPWLLEMNCNCPDFSTHDIIDETIKTDFMVNYLNVLGVVPFSHNTGKPLDEVYNYKDKIEEVVDDSLCEFERVDGDLELIFPKKDNIERYRKFFESPGRENELLWEKLKKI